MTNQPSSSGNANTSASPTQATSSPVTPTTPLFYADPELPEPMDPITPQTALPNNEISHGPSDNEEPSQLDEGEVAEEIWREHSWLSTLLAENETKAWETAYRDFVKVRLLLVAVQGLNIEEMGNNWLTKGVFLSEGREFTLSVWEFINILQLVHSSAT